nr:hypothetical protein BaRGS_015373 [Batillaria attramentaria]
MGKFEATLRYKDSCLREAIYVISRQQSGLLSKTACIKLGLIARVGELEHSHPDYKAEFPQLFEGLGRLKTECSIKLRDDASPVCLYTPRKVAYPLRKKVKAELEKMLQQGVISPVTQPTEWCSGIVVVPKPTGAVRICIDLTNLNKAVKREVHPIASVEESLAQIHGSKIFTRLDAKSAFHQLP